MQVPDTKPLYQIIGGGIGGLSMALSCQQQGLDYILWEKQPEISYRRVGLGISRNIFPLLHSWGVMQESRELGAEIKKMLFDNKKLKTLRTLSLKAPALSVDRLKFTKILLQQLKHENLRLSTSKSPADFSKDQTIIVAEGPHSPSRKTIYPQLKLRKSRQWIWRGMVELKLPPHFHNAYHDFIGGNLRFAIIHSGDNLYSWYAIEELQEEPPQETDTRQHLLQLFKEYHPLVHDCIGATESIYGELLQDMEPRQRKGLPWYKDNLVLIGDAIHPTTPNMANGACLAMEDAYVLAKLLKKYPNQPQMAFSTYQALREPKVNNIVQQSWLLGRMMHQQNPLIDKAIVLGTRLTPQWAFNLIYAPILNNESILKAEALAGTK